MIAFVARNLTGLVRFMRLDEADNRRFREVHSLPKERFALLFTAPIYILLAAGNLLGHGNLTMKLCEIAVIAVLTLAFYAFRPGRFRDLYIHLYSVYYILLFVILYYLPLAFGEAPDTRPKSYNYLLHLSLLVAQALRPHWRGGGLIILFLMLHSALVLAHDPRPFDSIDVLRFVLFVWLGAMVLYIERLNYLNSYRFFQMTDNKRREREEMRLAEQVHKNLFPSLEENDRIRLVARRMSPELIGGDFYDLVMLREGNLGLFFTDISGHGLSSAMMSAAVKVILQGMPYRNRLDPPRLLTHIDQVIHREYGSHHASAIYLFLDFHERIARLANAGHPPLLYSRDGEPFREIESEGVLLGFGLGDPIAEERTLSLQAGDRFLIYSDGLLELKGKNDNSFLPHVREFLDGLETFPATEIPDEFLSRIRARPEFAGFRDDVMLVLLEVKRDAFEK